MPAEDRRVQLPARVSQSTFAYIQEHSDLANPPVSKGVFLDRAIAELIRLGFK